MAAIVKNPLRFVTFVILVSPTPSPEHTVDALCTLAKRLRRDGPGAEPPASNHKPRLRTAEDWQLYVVSSLPGVGPKLGRRLLSHFGTVRRVVNAGEALAEVEGIAAAKAAKINRVLDQTFVDERLLQS